MSELLDSLNERLGNSVTENCSASQCAIDFDSFPSHFKAAEKIAIDVDDAVEKEKIAVQGKRCDFLIIIEKADLILVLLVEIKGERVRPSEVFGQIEGGKQIFLDLVKKINTKTKKEIKFMPCCLSQRIHRRDREGLERRNIRYVKCGKRFWEKIKKELQRRW